MKMRSRRLAILIATAALAIAATSASAPVANGATCTPATNIEAIIDDSGSMSGTDFNKLRAQGLKLLIAKPGNANKTLGAVEFGDSVATVFAPATIGSNSAGMSASIDAATQGDNGSTDYNIAFAKAAADNPTANARIFLTDGGHNAGDYTNGHAGGPPTYVVGLGVFSGDDETRLQTIANDTGGKYLKANDASELQAAINEIDAYLNCQAPPVRYSDTFTKQGQTKTHRTTISSSVKSVDLVLTWADPTDTFIITGVRLKTSRGTYAKVSARKRLRIKRSKGSTYYSLNIRKLRRGKLVFKVKLTKKASFNPSLTTITQATRNR
jgi:hypothetical protein